MVASEYHSATDHSMMIDPSTINNKHVIVLFIENMYNEEIHRRVAGAKNVNTLLDAFK